MREVFILEDILNALIALETHGNALYLDLAERAGDLETRNLFTSLAKQELRHKEIYTEFKDRLTLKTEIEEEYLDYLNELIRSNIHLERMDVKACGFDEALDIGIQLEKDTILFLSELKGILSENTAQIEALVLEEKNHLKLLLPLKGS
jgi:rubrerythrin